MALSFVFLKYFSCYIWLSAFLAQYTLHDLHQILIKAIPGCSKPRVSYAANCNVFSCCKLHSLLVFNPFFIYVTLFLLLTKVLVLTPCLKF